MISDGRERKTEKQRMSGIPAQPESLGVGGRSDPFSTVLACQNTSTNISPQEEE